MPKKEKLKRYAEVSNFSNVCTISYKDALEGQPLLTNWLEGYFISKEAPISLELGCGKGDYVLALSKRNPSVNYIGVDIKGDRIWKGAKQVLDTGIPNVAFARMRVEQIAKVLLPHSVQEIWLTFPDPQIKSKREKLRLVNPDYLRLYHKILKPGGTVHLKTDSEFLHGYTIGVLRGQGQKIITAYHDISCAEEQGAFNQIQTFYEKKYLKQGKPITYLYFQLDYP